jgi:hypothetical protein
MIDRQEAYTWFSGSEDFSTYSATVQVKNRNVFAETALAKLSGFDVGLFGGGGGWGSMEISQTVSDSGVEQFDTPVVFRTNVTSVTVTLATWNTRVRGRLVLHFWS